MGSSRIVKRRVMARTCILVHLCGKAAVRLLPGLRRIAIAAITRHLLARLRALLAPGIHVGRGGYIDAHLVHGKTLRTERVEPAAAVVAELPEGGARLDRQMHLQRL